MSVVYFGPKRKQSGLELQDAFDSLPRLDVSESMRWLQVARGACKAEAERWRTNGRRWFMSGNTFGMRTKRVAVSYESAVWCAEVYARLVEAVELKTNIDIAHEVHRMAAFLERELGGQTYTLDASALPDVVAGRADTECCKSNDWMAALLYDAVDTKPECVNLVRLRNKDAVTHVFSDDAAYSGMQMGDLLRDITSQGQEQGHTFFVMVPFMTCAAWRHITRNFQDGTKFERMEDAESLRFEGSGMSWTFWKPKHILETRDALESILVTFPDDEHVAPLKQAVREELAGAGVGLCIFQHKFPDIVSFPGEFDRIKLFIQHAGFPSQEPYKSRNGAPVRRPLACAS